MRRRTVYPEALRMVALLSQARSPFEWLLHEGMP